MNLAAQRERWGCRAFSGLAVGGEPIKQSGQRDLGTELCRQPSEPEAALAFAQFAAEPHHDVWISDESVIRHNFLE